MLTLRLIRVVVVLALTSLCALAQPQQPPLRTETAEPAATGAITGRVVNENGQPLPGVLVQVRAVGNGRGQMTSTDREGEFRVNNLDRATYAVDAVMPAYTPAPRDPSTPAPTYRIGDTVNLTLIKGGVITGTVTNAAGDPVVGINVRVQMVRDANGRRLPSGFSRERSTDDRGVYRMYGLPAGTYVVVAAPTTYASSESSAYDGDAPTYAPSSTRDTATEISVRAGDEVSGVDIRYRAEQGRVISGVVNSPPDSAFNVILAASGEMGAPFSTTFFQSPGNRDFLFNGIADGDYQLVVMSYGRNGNRNLSTASKRVTVKGADVTGIELTTLPLGTVSGRIVLEELKTPECTDKQRPEFNETLVSAWHNDNEAAKETPRSLWSIGAPVPADADGNFVLRNLAPGEYYFVTRSPAKYWYLESIRFGSPQNAAAKSTSRSSDATLVWTKVKAGDQLSGLTITLAQGAASLRGQLVSGDGQIPEKLFVYLVPSEREKAEAVLRYFAAPVSPDGKIALHNIAPGRYWVLAQPFTEDATTPLTKLRLPHETESRARLRREAEAVKTEIEFKPCQNVTEFQLSLNPRQQ